MSEVNIFLRIMKSEGYPNPNIQSIANMVGYNLDEFLFDLKNEIGEEGVVDFCEKAVEKLSGKDGIKVYLDDDEFVYVHIFPKYYDEDESKYDVISNSSWGDSRILSTDEDGNEKYMTIEEVIDDADMVNWSEIDELVDNIRAKAYSIVYHNCGFGIWWE